MGAACSQEGGGDKEARERNKRIEEELRSEKKYQNAEVKLLMLGSGDSGKSTFARQMRIIHLSGFDEDELLSYKNIIRYNIMRNMRALVLGAGRFGLQIRPENEETADYFRQTRFRIDAMDSFGQRESEMIQRLWVDEAIATALTKGNELEVDGTAPYWFRKVQETAVQDYVPTEVDLLHMRAKTTGIVDVNWEISGTRFRLVDVGGQRNERKKWIHCFEGVTSVIFCVALSEYDMVLVENKQINRMHESLRLFEEVVNNNWFKDSNVILLLNKKDLFEEKVQTVDPQVCFPNYTGGCDYGRASSYIENKFKSKNRGGNDRSIYVHHTCATDTKNIRMIFLAVKDMLLQKTFAAVGFM